MIESFNLAIAIPDSALSDEMTKRDKTIKVSQFARACSIFRVNQIYIYHDDTSPPRSNDYHLLKTLLCYLDTPQYLRKQLFPHMKELEFAGILHPLKSPHHKQRQDAKDIKIGDIRVGVIVDIKGSLCKCWIRTPCQVHWPWCCRSKSKYQIYINLSNLASNRG